MKNFIYTALLLVITSLFTVGCTDAIVGTAIESAIDEIKDAIEESDDEIVDEISQGTLTLLKKGNNFSMAWVKNDTEYNEVIYKDPDGFREVIMEGTTAIIRSYECTFSEDTGESVNYSCVGLGTPGPENDSADGKITLNFQKDTDYAFFVDGELIYNILSYRDETLIINGQ